MAGMNRKGLGIVFCLIGMFLLAVAAFEWQFENRESDLFTIGMIGMVLGIVYLVGIRGRKG